MILILLELKDLGVIVDNHLTFTNHIVEKTNKANQIMVLIWGILVFLDKHNFGLLYRSLVRPHIEYGNILWSPFQREDINLIEMCKEGQHVLYQKSINLITKKD